MIQWPRRHPPPRRRHVAAGSGTRIAYTDTSARRGYEKPLNYRSMTVPAYRGRFAPSPTGALHFGSLVAAVGSWLVARYHGGQWLLRMEDIDPQREVPGAAKGILAALTAFGFETDEPVLFQSHRAGAYAAAF